jgi:D-beta-D-heptose 7-phosphate kinase/D-beta-D-heptose 1-phosphate adenosyltransferase
MSRIKVIGESCKDIFVYCDASRLAPDIPVPVLKEVYRISNPGMAANVHRNIQSAGEPCELVTNQTWQDNTKTRFVHEKSNHTFLRVDNTTSVENLTIDHLNLDAELIVISDYDKGFLSKSTIEYICHSHPLVFIDTKKILGNWAEKAAFIKVNDYEYSKSYPELTESLKRKIIRTRGSEGCDFQGINYPVDRVEVRDTSGAGDSFLAALVISFLRSGEIEESIRFANYSASKVVRTRGVGTI